MPVPLSAMKVQCPQCKRIAVFNSKSDFIIGLPSCTKCGITMAMLGKMTLLDWVKYSVNLIRNN